MLKSSAPVRFAGAPPAMNLTQTFVAPPASDRYAIHFPSGEIAGPNSWAAVATMRVTRSNAGGAAEARGHQTATAPIAAIAAAAAYPLTLDRASVFAPISGGTASARRS